MADDGDGQGQADTGPTTAELAARIDAQDSKLDMILSKLGGAKDQAHDAAQQHTEDRLDRPSSIADEIRAQFAERDRQAAADAKAAADDGWRKTVDEKLTGMAEKVPEAPVRRIEKAMGWR